MLCPALGRRTAHHYLIVRISDGAVVDRYQESIDLAHHLLGKQRSLRMRLPMFAAIGKSALRGQSQKGLLDALSRPAQQDALSADQSWARRRQISSDRFLELLSDSRAVSWRSDPPGGEIDAVTGVFVSVAHAALPIKYTTVNTTIQMMSSACQNSAKHRTRRRMSDAGLLDRYVQSGKIVHAALLLLMLEAVNTDLVSPSA